MERPLLELRNVTKDYVVGGGLGLIGKRIIRAVDNISFIIAGEKPAITALVGQSGSGKTTIARIILGLIKPTSGEVLYEGMDVRLWLKKYRKAYRRNVQIIFQDPYSVYNPFYRVDRVLSMTVKKLGLASSQNEVQKMIIESMKAIGLRPEDILGRYTHQISGGERQRLMLARILLIKPKLVIADEPVSMIDASLRAIFLNNLKELKERIKMSCIYITHDLNNAYYIADDIIILSHGRIVEKGEAKSVIKDPLHPYTQNLVKAIPIPDPDRRWKDIISIPEVGFQQLESRQACLYNYVCPYLMPICKKEIPPPIEVDSKHTVACFLYRKR